MLVTTTSRTGAFLSRSTAGPDSRPWVAAMITDVGAPVDEQLGRARERAAGVDHVVDEHAGAAFDRADDLLGDRDVVRALRPVLVDERELGVDVVLAEAVREPAGELAAAGVGRDDRDRFAVIARLT